MPFELTVATRGLHHGEAHLGDPGESRAIVVVLRGTLDAEALRRVADVLDEQRARAAASLFVELADVAADPPCLAALAERVMALRREQVDVQIDARDAALAERLRALPDARDWLVASGVDDEPGARRALHLDGPRLDEP